MKGDTIKPKSKTKLKYLSPSLEFIEFEYINIIKTSICDSDGDRCPAHTVCVDDTKFLF